MAYPPLQQATATASVRRLALGPQNILKTIDKMPAKIKDFLVFFPVLQLTIFTENEKSP